MAGRFSREEEVMAQGALDRAFLDAIFRQDEVGVAIWDTGLRYLRVNGALAAMNGRPAEEHIGRHVTDVLPGLGPEIVALLEDVMATGRSTRDIELGGDGGSWLATYYPLFEPGGTLVGCAGLIRDVTGRKRAETLLARREREASFLAEASAELAESLDFAATLRTAARLAVPALADWCAIDIVEGAGTVHRAAVAHRERDKEPLLWVLTKAYPAGPGGLVASPRSSRELAPDLPDSYLATVADDDEHLRLMRAVGMHSLMTVPLRARGRTFGALTLVAASPERRLDARDVELAENLATRAALAADNARLFGEREYISRTLQRSLLPPRLPDVPGVELAARYRPAGDAGDVGGDFYDVFPTTDGQWGLAIGDVAGKGPDAAAVTALARHTLHVAAAYEERPGRVLKALNDALIEDTPRTLLTAVYARLTAGPPATIEVACGGHPLPLIVRRDGRVEGAGLPGTLLGFEDEPDIFEREHALEPGDALVLYTDGVIESRPIDRALGTGGLAELLEHAGGWSAEALAELIEGAVEERSEGRQNDDVAILVVRVLPD
jgi:serine phosphatase RsbU (regulator of sigma subunit)